jgi:hypothetical protein
MKDKCPKCLKEFDVWKEYNAHRLLGRCRLVLVPLRTTTRTKAEIVTAFEERYDAYFLGGK